MYALLLFWNTQAAKKEKSHYKKKTTMYRQKTQNPEFKTGKKRVK